MLYDKTGSRKSKIAAAKPEMHISFLADTIPKARHHSNVSLDSWMPKTLVQPLRFRSYVLSTS